MNCVLYSYTDYIDYISVDSGGKLFIIDFSI